MRKLSFIIGVVLLALFTVLVNQISFGLDNPCDQPRAFSIGYVDEEFEISEQQVRDVVENAIQTWENVTESELFYFNPDAEFQVHLNYDARHSFIADMRELEKEFYGKRKELTEKSEELQDIYSERKADFDEFRREYERRLEQLNQRIAYWNEEGGIPPEERESIEAEQDSLNRMELELNDKRRAVNDIANRQNTINQELQQITDNFNAEVDRYQRQYGSEYKFDQGRYNGDEIAIFQFEDKNDLEFVLTHEFGHALGIGHVDDPNAVMYEVRFEQPVDPVELTNADEKALEQRCK